MGNGEDQDVTMSSPASATSDGMKLLGLNAAVWYNDGSPQTTRRINRFESLAEEYDLVALQEVFMPSLCGCANLFNWTDPDRLPVHLPNHNVAIAEAGCCRCVNSGLVVASKWPIIDSKSHALPSGGAWFFPCCCLKQHTLQEVTLHMGHSGSLTVLNTHLLPDEMTVWPCPMSLQSADALRYSQLNAVQSIMAGLHDRPWIATGDFNLDLNKHHHVATKLLNAQGATFAEEGTLNMTESWMKHPQNTLNPVWATDGVFWGGGVSLKAPAVRLDNPTQCTLSDHYAFETEVEIHTVNASIY